MHPKQNQKQIMHESNKSCMLQTGIKSHKSVKNKSDFINVTGDKFDLKDNKY